MYGRALMFSDTLTSTIGPGGSCRSTYIALITTISGRTLRSAHSLHTASVIPTGMSGLHTTIRWLLLETSRTLRLLRIDVDARHWFLRIELAGASAHRLGVSPSYDSLQ